MRTQDAGCGPSHRHRATLSAAPNFAFELCCKNVRDEDIEGLDLSSLRMVVERRRAREPGNDRAASPNGSRSYGFPARGDGPGLRPRGELRSGLPFRPSAAAPIIDRVQRIALSRDGKADPGRRRRRYRARIRRLRPSHSRPRGPHRRRGRPSKSPDRTEGRLQFKGPSATKGYFRNPEKTRALFDGEWLESGDRAYIADGDVFITGRIKDIIIKAGRHIYPHELEEVVGGIEGVRKGCVAAFPTMDERTGTERLMVLAETRLTDPGAIAAMKQRIVEAATALLDMPPDEVLARAAPHGAQDLERKDPPLRRTRPLRDRLSCGEGPCAVVAARPPYVLELRHPPAACLAPARSNTLMRPIGGHSSSP